MNWIYPLTGDVGMYDSVATFIRLQQADDPRPGDPGPVGNPTAPRVFTFADTLTYTTTFGGSLNATLTLKQVPEEFRITAANAGVSGSRTDIHKVTVTMAAGQQPQVAVDQTGRRRVVELTKGIPRIDAPVALFGGFNGGFGAGIPGNTVLSTRLLQQESGPENRAMYEQDRQRQLELQRRSTDVRVIVGP